MNLFKRWKTTIATSFDSVIYQVENHEAIVACTIEEAQKAAAKAKVKLNRVKQDGKQLKQRIQELQKLEESWKHRALQTHTTEKQKSLECLRRRKRVIKELEQLEAEYPQHINLENQLIADLHKVEERIAELKRKKNAMSAREYRGKAVQSNPWDNTLLLDDLDNIFERWEMKVAETEFNQVSTADSLEDEFLMEEEAAALEDELATLIESSKEDK